MNTLNSFFEKARQRRAMFDEESLREMIERRGHRRSMEVNRSAWPLFRRRSTMVLTIGALLLMSGLPVVMRSFMHDKPRIAQRGASTPVGSPARSPHERSSASMAALEESNVHDVDSIISSKRRGRSLGFRKADLPLDTNLIERLTIILPDSISALQPVKLSDAELARIGVRGDTEYVFFKSKRSGNKKARAEFWGVRSNESAIFSGDGSFKVDGLGLLPPGIRRVTNGRGKKLLTIVPEGSNDSISRARAMANDKMQLEVEKSLAKHLDSINVIRLVSYRIEDGMMKTGELIPILVRSKKRGAQPQDHWILWFEPRTELLDRLPKSVREQLKQEMAQAAEILAARKAEQLASVDTSAKPVSALGESLRMESRLPSDSLLRKASRDSARNKIPGTFPYLDVLRSSSGALSSTSLFPNPAFIKVAVEYTLTSPRTVTVKLYDLAGELIGTVAEPEAKGVGRFRVIVDLQGVSSGVYMIAIITDGGECAVQRLFVK